MEKGKNALENKGHHFGARVTPTWTRIKMAHKLRGRTALEMDKKGQHFKARGCSTLQYKVEATLRQVAAAS